MLESGSRLPIVYVQFYDFISGNRRARQELPVQISVFDHDEFKKSALKLLRVRPTTGNSNMAFQTGSTYTSGNKIDSVEILTANLGFATVTS